MGAADPGGGTVVEPRDAGPGRASTAVATLPNLISLTRLATVPVFVWLFATGRETAAVVLYAVAASSDFLDGFIARRTRSISELGKLLDPLADRIFIAALAIALVARGALPLWLALVLVARDVVVLSAFPLLERRGVERIPVSFIGKTATAALLLGLTLLAVAETPLAWRDAMDGPGLVFIGLGTLLYWVAGALYAREAMTRVRDLEHEPPVV